LAPFRAYAGPGSPSLGPQVVAFPLERKVVGLITSPLDGCPARSMGLIAHPGEIAGMVVSADGRYVFTASGRSQDPVVHKWRVDARAVEALGKLPSPTDPRTTTTTSVGGGVPASLARWAGTLEGGLDGELVHELLDYFTYLQILRQGESTSAQRNLPGKIAPEDVPELLRALGVYLSQAQAADVVAEVLLMTGCGEPDALVVDVTLAVQMYVNHRPMVSTSVETLEQAFVSASAAFAKEEEARQAENGGSGLDPNSGGGLGLGNSRPGTAETRTTDEGGDDGENDAQMYKEIANLSQEQLYELLTRYGEPMTDEELEGISDLLLGGPFEDVCPGTWGPRGFSDQVLGFEA